MTGETTTPEEFMLSFYADLLEAGWKMNEIDEMDIFYYFRVLGYRNKKQPQTAYIDQILP